MDNRIIDLRLDEFKTIIGDIIRNNLKDVLNKEGSKELLTRKETAKRLGISLSTLHDYTSKGILPAYRIGNRVYYRWEDILKAAKRVEPLPPLK